MKLFKLPEPVNYNNPAELREEIRRLKRTAEIHLLLHQEAIKNLEELTEKYPLLKDEEEGGIVKSALSEVERKILLTINNKGVATANDVYKSSRRYKASGLTTEDIGKIMKELASMDLCIIIPTNKGVKVKSKKDGKEQKGRGCVNRN